MQDPKTFTYEDVKSHDLLRDLWVVIGNSVYNMTPWVENHSGGTEVLLENAGKDATLAFYDMCNPEKAKAKLDLFKIGELVREERKTVAQLRREVHTEEYNKFYFRYTQKEINELTEKNSQFLTIENQVFDLTGLQTPTKEFATLVQNKKPNPEKEDKENLEELFEKFFVGEISKEKEEVKNVDVPHVEKVQNEPADLGFGQSIESKPVANPMFSNAPKQVNPPSLDKKMINEVDLTREGSSLEESPKNNTENPDIEQESSEIKEEDKMPRTGVREYLQTGALIAIATSVSVVVTLYRKLGF